LTEVARNTFHAGLLMIVATGAINMLSGYIRHTEAGLGCEPWPACYAVVGEYTNAPAGAAVASRALTPTETAKQLHRATATALVILIALVIYQARQRLAPSHGFAVHLPYMIILVILILSVVGPASYMKTLPAVATVNLVGGIGLFVLGWWLWLTLQRPDRTYVAPFMLKLASAAVTLTLVQICTGAWVSANFAATACTDLLGCGIDASATASGTSGPAFWYFRDLTLDDSGRIIIDGPARSIHIAHKLMAIPSATALAWLSLQSLREDVLRPWCIALLGLLGVQICLGAGSIALELPKIMVLAHNLCAGLLLACALRIRLMMRN